VSARTFTLSPVAVLPQHAPDTWEGLPRWRWFRAPQAYAAACARVRLSALRRAVVDCIAARIWGPQGGRHDGRATSGLDEVDGCRWTVRELAAVLTVATSGTVHRTDVDRALAWLLAHGVIARRDAGLGDGSFRYLIRPYEHWTRAASVAVGDPGYPARLVDAPEHEQDSPQDAQRAPTPPDGAPTTEPASSGPQGAANAPPFDAPTLPPWPTGTPALEHVAAPVFEPPLSTSRRDDRARHFQPEETDPTRDAFPRARELGTTTAPVGASSAPRGERAASWYVVVGRERVPLWNAVKNALAGEWAEVARTGGTARHAIDASDRIERTTGQRWHSSATRDAIRLAIVRAAEAAELEREQERRRVAQLVDDARGRAAEALERVDELHAFERDDGIDAAARAVRDELRALGRGGSEVQIVAYAVRDRVEALEREVARPLRRRVVAQIEREQREREQAAELRAEAGRAAQRELGAELGRLLALEREHEQAHPPRVSTLPVWGDVVARARARERERDALTVWALRSASATPEQWRDAHRRAAQLRDRLTRTRQPSGTPNDGLTCPDAAG
jgi:hypothetical protein